MRIALVLVLILVACVDHSPLPRNRAVAFVTFAEPSAECLPLDTGHKWLPDTATCRIKGALVYCASAEGAKPDCKPYVDPAKTALRGPAEAPPQDQMSPNGPPKP